MKQIILIIVQLFISASYANTNYKNQELKQFTSVCDRSPKVALALMTHFKTQNCTSISQDMLRNNVKQLKLTSLESLTPSDLSDLYSVEELYLYNFPESSFTKELFTDLKSLTWLEISIRSSSKRKITLPESPFVELSKLKYLFIAYFQVDTLPEHFFVGLDSLKELWLHHTYNHSMPKKMFEHLPSLDTLRFKFVHDLKLEERARLEETARELGIAYSFH